MCQQTCRDRYPVEPPQGWCDECRKEKEQEDHATADARKTLHEYLKDRRLSYDLESGEYTLEPINEPVDIGEAKDYIREALDEVAARFGQAHGLGTREEVLAADGFEPASENDLDSLQ